MVHEGNLARSDLRVTYIGTRLAAGRWDAAVM